MNRGTNYMLIAVFALLLGSCAKHELKGPAFVQYIQQPVNGFKKDIHTTELEYSVLYKPYEYIIYQESQGNIKSGDLAKRMSLLKGTAWFNLSFRMTDGKVSPLKYGVSNLEQYNERLNYYINYAANDLRLVYGADTLRPMSYLFETNYNLTPQETIVVGFDLKNNDLVPDKDVQLIYYDKVFKNGIIKAFFSKELFNHIPKLINEPSN